MSFILQHAGTSVISALFEGFYNSGLWENIFWSMHKDQYIWHKNNIAQLYFILRGAELCWNFSNWLRDTPDTYRFPAVHLVKTHFPLKNLWISGASLGILGKIQCNSAVSSIKYNCAILFLCQMYWSFVYTSKYMFL